MSEYYLPPEAGGGGFEPIPAGVYEAICIGFVHQGTQFDKHFDKWKQECSVRFEIPEIRRDDGAPRLFSNKYTYSMGSKANLRKMLEGWRGKAYTSDEEAVSINFNNMVGVSVMLTLGVKGDYNTLLAASPAKKKLVPETKLTKFWITGFKCQDDADVGMIGCDFPEKLQGKIKGCKEYTAMPKTLAQVVKPTDQPPAEDNDDLPF